jgi:hypothetical protein
VPGDEFGERGRIVADAGQQVGVGPRVADGTSNE